MYTINKISANPTVDFAAEELKKYLRMMLPRAGEIHIGYDTKASDGFRLSIMSDLNLDTSDAKDPSLDDIVYIDANNDGGIIAGSNPAALLIAVYRYLRFCGCRWIFPGVDGEQIPIINSLPVVKYRKLADHRYRGQCNEGAENQQFMLDSIDFAPKIGMNTYMIQFDNPFTFYDSYHKHVNNPYRASEPIHRDTTLRWKRCCESEIKKRGLRFHDMGHGWTAEPLGLDSSNGWNPADSTNVPEETVELLAMLDGKRQIRRNSPLMTNVCMSNPKARRLISDYIADYAQKQNNVDYLHIWLADASNGQCECSACRQKLTSDWYVILLNEIDEELSRRGLDTHLMFIAYLDTMWAPVEERLKNSTRFTLLYAPITRLYTETYAQAPDMSAIAKYELNNIKKPKGMAECLAYLHQWKNKMWQGDCVSFEYYFMDFQYMDVSGMFLSKIIYEDIINLKKHGLDGIIQVGTQRSFFPTGFRFYVLGETLFDSQVSYEDLKNDYFSHAFGKNYEEVVSYLETLQNYLDFAYYFGTASSDPQKGPYYNPDMAENAAKAHSLADNFAPTIAKNKNQYYRSSSVAWQLLEKHLTVVKHISDMTKAKCVGNHGEAIKYLDAMTDATARAEIYIEPYFDQYLFAATMESYAEGMRETAERNVNL